MDINLKLVRFDPECNQNFEAIKGQWGQFNDRQASFTMLKNILVIHVFNGARYDGLKLPDVYDGIIQCSDGNIIQIRNSTLTCELPEDVNGFGILTLKRKN